MNTTKPSLERVSRECLSIIEREREREIISRRFGLYDRKETLEQIGDMLGITRERVRQLEKAVLKRLRDYAASGNIASLNSFEAYLVTTLEDLGNVATLNDAAAKIAGDNSPTNVARLLFLATLCQKIEVIEEDDDHYGAVAILNVHDAPKIKQYVKKIVEHISSLGKPAKIEKIAEVFKGELTPLHVRALSTLSKKIAHLNNHWGLNTWATVNPRNIRDKIYLILKQRGSHMHFGEIAEAIKASDFKRKDVTVQAIHNELIKDKRFVLVGRGRYALKEWGYSSGTVADVITDILKKTGPLHRDDIVKEVLKSRFVKDTTILLNLQAKPQFKRVAKATYALAE